MNSGRNIFISLVVSLVLLLGVATADASELQYKEVMFAREGADGRMIHVDNAEFKRGEKVHMVLLEVGKFVLGADGKHRFDLDLFVKDSAGQVVLNEPGLLKEQGHTFLEGGIAPSLSGIFTSHVGLKSGTYQMTVVIRDLVGGGILKVTKPFSLNAKLSFTEAVFARKNEDGNLQRVDDAVFNRGEIVHLVLLNVGTFVPAANGEHWFDIHMLVTNASGAVVLDQKNLLNENGKGVLKDNIAESPYGMFYTDLSMAPGEYKIKLTVEDRIGGQTLQVTRKFYLK